MVFEWEWGEGSRGEVAVGEEGGRRKGKGGKEWVRSGSGKRTKKWSGC